MWSLRIRRLLPKAGLLGLALTISVVLAEVVVRLALPQFYITGPRGMFVPDPPRRFRLSPGVHGTLAAVGEFSHSISINSLGMRGPEIGKKSPETYRIVALGDSFTFGFGVEIEQTFIALAQDRLRSTVSGNIEIINNGVPAFGLPDEVAWFEQYSLQLEPDLVIINVCLANDLFDATEDEISTEMYKRMQAEKHWSLGAWLFRRSHLYRLVSQAAPVRALLGMPESWPIARLREMIRMHTDTPSELTLKGRRANQAALARLAELAEQHDFRLGAMLIPVEYQLVPERWKRLLNNLGLDPTAYDPEVPRRFFLNAFAEHDIPVLDLWLRFQAEMQNGEQLFFRKDPHWTPAGHRLVADTLSAFIVDENLVESPKPAIIASTL